MTTLLLIIPNLGTGGAQKVFRDQLRFYSGHYKTIGCVFNRDGSLPEDNDLNIISLDVPAGKNVLSKAVNFLRRIRRLRTIKRTNNVTHSISHLEGADYVNILSRANESVICWLHGTKKFDRDIAGVLGAIRRKVLMPLLYKRNIHIVTVSEGIRTELISTLRINPIQITTILNGFDLESIDRKKNEASSISLKSIGDKIVVTHCRLAPQKNIEGMIDIFTLVKQSHHAKLAIIGDGKLRTQLVSKAESNGLAVYCAWSNAVLDQSYDVYFLGHQSNPFSLLAHATLYAMTSSWEGFPLALGEALACGLPSMSTDCFTGPREVIAPDINLPQPIDQPHFANFGVLMPLADSSEHKRVWSETIIRLLDDPILRQQYSTAGIRRVSVLNQRNINQRWLDLISNG